MAANVIVNGSTPQNAVVIGGYQEKIIVAINGLFKPVVIIKLPVTIVQTIAADK
jgi:hypothetical protein